MKSIYYSDRLHIEFILKILVSVCASKEGGVVCPGFFCQDQEWDYSVDIEKVIIKEESVKEVKGSWGGVMISLQKLHK